MKERMDPRISGEETGRNVSASPLGSNKSITSKGQKEDKPLRQGPGLPGPAIDSK